MNRLKALREDADLTQAELAKAWGVSVSSISQWELGTRQMDYTTLIMAAKYFGTSIDYILKNEEMPMPLTEQEQTAIDILRDNGPSKREAMMCVLNIINNIANDR